MSSSRTSTVFTVAAVTVLGGLVAYAVYFDYKRRNDVEFRKKLRKEKKKVTKQTQQAQAQADAASEVSAAEIKAALLKIREEELPPTPDEKETYFIMQVQVGEQLAQKGPAFYLPAAMAFFRAMRVYPSPVELIMMLQSSLPPPLFKIFMEFVNAETTSRIEGYYDHFPPKRMNVSVQTGPAQGNQAAKKILVAEKDFEEGDVIYTEKPLVVALDADLEGEGKHCSFCFRPIQEDLAVIPTHDKLDSVYCSKDCENRAKLGWQNLLFGLEPVLPAELDNGMGALTTEQRHVAQSEYTEFIQTKAKQANLLAARFVAKQIAHELIKLLPNKTGPIIEELQQLADGKDPYLVGDHIERLRFVEGNSTKEEVKLLGAVLGTALPGLEESITDERHAVIVGKMAYNAIGVCPDGGRDNRPVSSDRPEELERTRTPYGTARQIGSGVYIVSSYLAHSCDPNTRPTFPNGTNELHLVAARPIKKGDELTMAWVDVSQHEGESAGMARRRRRIELARGWRFKCECAKCVREAMDELEQEQNAAHDAALGVSGDESKVEAVMRHEKLPGQGMGPD
ncbi:MAS20-domain-containing protein [Trametes polyzona]|nr:MAS20-domain-containing protein [Trametes polyzona]